MTFDNSGELLNNLTIPHWGLTDSQANPTFGGGLGAGLFRYPGVNPPTINQMPPPGGMVPNYGQAGLSPVPAQTTNPALPVTPQAPNPNNQQPGDVAPSSTAIPASNDPNDDFLKVVRDTAGGIAHGVLDVLGATNYAVAQPLYMGLFHPLETGQFLAEGAIKGENPWAVIDQKFQESNDLGLQKFVGTALLDPLTYAGGLGLAGKAAQVPRVGGALAKAIRVAETPGRLVDTGLARVGEKVGPLATGILNNEVDLTPVKNAIAQYAQESAQFQQSQNAARQILGKILPGGTVENILNTLPDTYTGLNIEPIANVANRLVPNLGLPTILTVPEVRILNISDARSLARTATTKALGENRIDPTMQFATQDQIVKFVRKLYSTNPANLTPSEGQLQSLMKEPIVLGRTDFNRFSKLVGGSVSNPNSAQLRELNSIVGQFRRGPVLDPIGGMDEQTAITAVGQLVGADLSDPDKGVTISRWLQARTDQSRLMLNQLSQKNAGELIDWFTERAGNQTKANWDLKIKAERDQSTYFNQMLNFFDGAYTNVYKNLIASEIQGPLSKSYLGFAGFVPMNIAETYVRQILGGGGFKFNTLSADAFRNAMAYYPDVPSRLLQLSPGERAAQTAATNLSESVTGIYGQGRGPIARLSGADWNPLNWLLDKGNDLEMGMQRYAYTQMVKHNRDALIFERGLPIRTDMEAYFAAANPLNVTTDPRIGNLSQELVNGLTNTAIHTVGQPDSYDSLIASLNAGYYNREALAGAIDSADLADKLHPTSRDIWVRGMRGVDPNSEAFGKVINDVIQNEYNLIASDPDVIEAKFTGWNSRINALANKPNATSNDLYNAYNHLYSIVSQFDDLPAQLRQGEYSAIRHAMGETQSGWRRALHEEWNKKFQDSLDKVGAQLDIANNSLSTFADRFGVRPEMDRVVGLLKSDQQLTIDTWFRDLEFQGDFFAKNRIGKNITNLDAYYAGRQAIWDPYYGERQVIQLQLTQANQDMQLKMRDLYAQEQVNKAAAAAQAQMLQLVTPKTIQRVGSGQYRQDIGDFNVAITRTGKTYKATWFNRATNQTDTEFTGKTLADITDQMNERYHQLTNWRPTIDKPISGDPGQDAIAHKIIDDLNNGADHDHIVSNPNYNAIAADASAAGGESTAIPRYDTSGQPIPESRPSQPISSGVNGASGQPEWYDSNGVIANRYQTADGLRPRLEQAIVDIMNNPAMTDENVGALTDWLTKFRDEFNALPETDRHTLNEVSKDAISRANKMFANTYVDYDGRNKFDWMMQHVFPFWMYESRRWPWLGQQLTSKPALAEMYHRYMDTTDQGYIPLGEIPYEINPLRGTVFGAISQLTDPDRPLKYTYGLQASLESINATLAKFGLYLGPAISIPANAILGQTGSSVPPLASTAINLLHSSQLPIGSDLAGAAQDLLPDPFKDYYTRMILASQGNEPDKIYEGALNDPNSSEAHILDAATRQSDLVSVVLRQTGLLRFRTPEYTKYRQAREEAIANLTGISPAMQDFYRENGQSIYQVTHLTPEQQQKLAAIPGTREFTQITEPLLNPAAQRLRTSQREYYDTLANKRAEELAKQKSDDDLFSRGAISGAQWRQRYQDRNSVVSTMAENLRESPAYKDVPITPEQQAQARQRFNLPAYVDDPISIGLNQYYSIQPQADITGEVNWADFFDARDQFLKDNPSIAAEIDRRSKANDTVQVQDFKRAAKILRPYFGLSDEVAKRYPQLAAAQDTYNAMKNVNPMLAAEYRDNNGSLQLLSRMITQARDQARKQFPQIDAALVTYYGATPIAYDAFKKATSQSFAGGLGAGLFHYPG